MSISFSSGSYFSTKSDQSTLFSEIYDSCLHNGFSYLSAKGYGIGFNENLEKILNNERNGFWIKGNGGELCVAIGDNPVSFGFPPTSDKYILYLLFDYCFITNSSNDINSTFLESIIKLQIDLYRMLNADLCWAGYDLSVPTFAEYHSGEINALRWFNILGKRFVKKIGRKIIIDSHAWEIKELPDGSIVLRLSEHPDVYEKINGEYLHEYLGLDLLR